MTIRFALPDGICVRLISPCRQCTLDDGHVEIHTEDELPVLHALTGWALERDLRLPGLLGGPGHPGGRLPAADQRRPRHGES